MGGSSNLFAQGMSGGRSGADLPAPTLPRKYEGKPTKAAISSEDLMTRLYKFADDSMLGREAGTIGNWKGTEYIASELKRMGLQPGGDNGTYFQVYPMFQAQMDSTLSWFKFGDSQLTVWKDFFPAMGLEMDSPQLDVIYAGPAGAPNPLTQDQMTGKIVVFGAPTEESLKADPNAMGKYQPMARGASANAYIGMGRLSASRITEMKAAVQQINVMMARQMRIAPTIYLSAEGAEKIFGKKLSELKPGDEGTRASIKLAFKRIPAPYPARNVIAILPGSDPKLKHTYVSVGAHNDHVGQTLGMVDHDSLRIHNYMTRPGGAENRGGVMLSSDLQNELNSILAEHRKLNPPKLDSVFNGADDDGSGSMAVLEIAEYLSSLKKDKRPKRSILFVWHTGEEKGLLGSIYFTDSLKSISHDSIVANINIDMIGRGYPHDQKLGGDDFLQLVGSKRLSQDFGAMVEEVNTAKGHNFKFDYTLDANGHPAQIYCRSDHASYARFGIPVVFFFTGTHSDYHMLTDEPQYINYPHMTKITNYINDLIMHVANRAERPKVDGPKPNPRSGCRQ